MKKITIALLSLFSLALVHNIYCADEDELFFVSDQTHDGQSLRKARRQNPDLSALMFACWHNVPLYVFKRVLQATESVNKPNKNGLVALFLAAQYGQRAKVKQLLERGASRDQKHPKLKMTALQVAQKTRKKNCGVKKCDKKRDACDCYSNVDFDSVIALLKEEEAGEGENPYGENHFALQ